MDGPARRIPPYRIVTDRLVVRCWQPADAAALKEAIDASLDHLRPWMPWAWNEPESVALKMQRVRRFRGNFDLGLDFVYGIFDRDESRVLGGSGLHTRAGEGALEIGYWVRADSTGMGLITESSAALTRAAFELCGVDRVEIHCDPANTRSAAVPIRLGYTEEGVLRRRHIDLEGVPNRRDVRIFSLLASEYAGSPSARAEFVAYDAAGERVL
jgi:RimJ/RimL family protein N-acetyltransferase